MWHRPTDRSYGLYCTAISYPAGRKATELIVHFTFLLPSALQWVLTFSWTQPEASREWRSTQVRLPGHTTCETRWKVDEDGQTPDYPQRHIPARRSGGRGLMQFSRPFTDNLMMHSKTLKNILFHLVFLFLGMHSKEKMCTIAIQLCFL